MPVLLFLFRCHDLTSGLVGKYFLMLKRAILIAAHLSLFGFLLPDMRRSFGSLALSLLLGIVFLSPLGGIFRTRLLLQLMGLRRELGIFMAYLALVHGLGYMTDPLWLSYFVAPYASGNLSAMDLRNLLGLLALILTLPLLFTSNNVATRLLRSRNWKRLHRLVYLVLFFALFHKFLRFGIIRVGDIVPPTLIFLVYLFAKALAYRNIFPPLRNSIDWVAERYRQYRATLPDPSP